MKSEAGEAVPESPSLHPSFCCLLPAGAPGQHPGNLFHLFSFSPESSLLFNVVSFLNEAPGVPLQPSQKPPEQASLCILLFWV